VAVHRVTVYPQRDLLPKREPQNVRHRPIVPGLVQSGRREPPDRPDSGAPAFGLRANVSGNSHLLSTHRYQLSDVNWTECGRTP
jgi:hypothetical protein